MSFFGTSGESVPSEFSGLFDHVPEEEDIIYWMRADNTSFWNYYKYINSETCWSCPPFSWIFPCCNVFNMPCIYSDYRNNSSKILMMTKSSVIFGSVDTPFSSCCFTPEEALEHVEVYTWRSIKYIGSKQEFNGMNKGSSSPINCLTTACFNEPQDILLIAKTKKEANPRGIWMDYVPYRAMRLDDLRQLRSEVIAAGPVRNTKGIHLVELGNLKKPEMCGSEEDSLEKYERKVADGTAKQEYGSSSGLAGGSGGYESVEREEEDKSGYERSESAEVDELGVVYTGGDEFGVHEAEEEGKLEEIGEDAHELGDIYPSAGDDVEDHDENEAFNAEQVDRDSNASNQQNRRYAKSPIQMKEVELLLNS